MIACLVLVVACGGPSQEDRALAAADLVDAGRVAEAADEFSALYAEGYPPAARCLGVCLLVLGDAEGAVACLLESPPSEDLGSAWYAAGNNVEAAAVFCALVTGDPLTLCNLAAAMHAEGVDAESLFELVLSMSGPHDEVRPNALLGLADYASERGDEDLAWRIRAQAEYLKE